MHVTELFGPHATDDVLDQLDAMEAAAAVLDASIGSLQSVGQYSAAEQVEHIAAGLRHMQHQCVAALRSGRAIASLGDGYITRFWDPQTN